MKTIKIYINIENGRLKFDGVDYDISYTVPCDISDCTMFSNNNSYLVRRIFICNDTGIPLRLDTIYSHYGLIRI